MLDVFLMLVAMAVQGGGGDPSTDSVPVTPAPQETAQAAPEVPMGKFTTAQEVRPILGMTKANWIAVREYDGHDIIYFTQLMSWRCGLSAIRYAINDGPMQDFELPACYIDTATPNSIGENDTIMIMGLALGSVQKVTVEITYDDGETDSASYERSAVLMP